MRIAARSLALAATAACPGLLASCAGPSTPLGAIWATHPSQVAQPQEGQGAQAEPVAAGPSAPVVPTSTSAAQSTEAQSVKIDFNPTRQVLHGPKPLVVRIQDPNGIPKAPRIQVRYDGRDVTRSFLAQAHRTSDSDDKELLIHIPVVRLSPHEDHRIEVRYYDADGERSSAMYRPPVCKAFDYKQVKHTDHFTPGDSLLAMIQNFSERAKINPSLTTALIAQESSFNPRTVSWAKAIGLTQVTQVAEDEISDGIADYERWPHYKGIERIPASVVKMMVLTGRINERNDWRLDRELSVRGGLAYILKLQKRWSTPKMMARFDEIERTKLILASYNSGSARVLQALHLYGKNWIKAPGLREARKYVNRIFSFCDFFSQDEGDKNGFELPKPAIRGDVR